MRSLQTKAFVWFLLAASCGSESDQRLFTNVLEVKTLNVGPEESMVTLGRGRTRVDVTVPAGALPVRTPVTVTLVSGVVTRGRAPVSGRGVLIEPSAVAFQTPARVRQAVPPAPVGRRYRTVVVPPGADAFVVRRAARKVGDATAETEGDEIWEGESDGAGLWGLALEEPGDEGIAEVDAGSVPQQRIDGGTSSIDAGATRDVDAAAGAGGSTVMLPNGGQGGSNTGGAGGGLGSGGVTAVDAGVGGTAGSGGASGSGGVPDAGIGGMGGSVGEGGMGGLYGTGGFGMGGFGMGGFGMGGFGMGGTGGI